MSYDPALLLKVFEEDCQLIITERILDYLYQITPVMLATEEITNDTHSTYGPCRFEEVD